MIFEHTASAKRWIERVQGFVDAEIRPAVPIFHEQERELPATRPFPSWKS